MFIVIKHGDNRQFLANINCSVLLLTHYLRDKVGLHRTDSIDLCEENGTLKLIFLVKFPEDNASKFLTARGTYYVCKVERGTTGTKNEHSYRAFHPLIKSPPQDLLDSLRNQCEYLEKSRLKMLKNQDGKKPPTMEALLSYMANQVVVRLPPFALSQTQWVQDSAFLPLLCWTGACLKWGRAS
uniref:Chromosome X open reading frame 65 n=1 Tax=Laticauda laticaudata TaxID=8630 RepID=A0A8C5S7W8_LATLA